MENTRSLQTDTTLARAAAQGEGGAFDEIMRRYMAPLAQYAAAKTSVQDAEDIVQETFLRAYQNIAAFDDCYTLKSWLFTIASRLLISLYRKKRPGRLSDETDPPAVPPDSCAADAEWLWAAVQRMGPAYHTVLWLRYQQQMTTDEIAQAMGKSVIGVRVLLHRARNRLARTLESEQFTSVGVRRSVSPPTALIERTNR
jgi:RNA polymerase sigma-70 factor (ECF subfamily)